MCISDGKILNCGTIRLQMSVFCSISFLYMYFTLKMTHEGATKLAICKETETSIPVLFS